MVIIMDMDSGSYSQDAFGAFEEEVLNAQWMPQPPQPALQLGLQEAVSEPVMRAPRIVDVDAFLRDMYSNQE